MTISDSDATRTIGRGVTAHDIVDAVFSLVGATIRTGPKQ